MGLLTKTPVVELAQEFPITKKGKEFYQKETEHIQSVIDMKYEIDPNGEDDEIVKEIYDLSLSQLLGTSLKKWIDAEVAGEFKVLDTIYHFTQRKCEVFEEYEGFIPFKEPATGKTVLIDGWDKIPGGTILNNHFQCMVKTSITKYGAPCIYVMWANMRSKDGKNVGLDAIVKGYKMDVKDAAKLYNEILCRYKPTLTIGKRRNKMVGDWTLVLNAI